MNRKILIGVVVGALVVLAALAVTMPAAAVRKDIGNDELVQLQQSGALLVDVRTTSEFATGHIGSAINIPVDQIAAASATWSKTRPVIVYCATGARSSQAADILASEGFAKVYNLKAGIVAWNGAVVTGQSQAAAPSGPSAVQTSGKPTFIEFATST